MRQFPKLYRDKEIERMKEIKAFIPARRIARVTEALRESGLCDLSSGDARCRNVTVAHVQRLLTAPDPALQQYSVDLAELVVAEAKLELTCPDELVDEVVRLIPEAARSGRPGTGLVYVSDIEQSVEIG